MEFEGNQMNEEIVASFLTTGWFESSEKAFVVEHPVPILLFFL